MRPPESPPDESLRLQFLRGLEILDTPAEERFDRLTRIARDHFGVPIALVSLVDESRQWFKSRQGLDAPETGREISFCGHAILSEQPLLVPNALEDERFADNPLVTGPPHIRFYAGTPLVTGDGFRLGTLCLIDTRPRKLNQTQIATLRDLAGAVTSELEEIPVRRAALLAQEHKVHLQAVLDNVVDGILTINEQGIIQTINPATERIFGYTSEELVGRNVNMLMPETFASQHDGYIRNYLSTGEAKIIGSGREVSGRRKDASEFAMDLAVAEMPHGNQRYFVGVVRDISERKRVEEMKDQFVSMVSHELRTPLTSIRGSLSLVLGKMKGQLAENIVSLLENANRNSERLSLLINDILDLEKIESGTLTFDFAEVELNQLCTEAVESIQGFANKHGVSVKLEQSDAPVLIRADGHRLLQVMDNLLSNAIKFSPPQSKVRVRIKVTESDCEVSVRDHGRGVPDAFRSRLFKRFAQADSSDSREKGGTGLGLSISKAIVERHEGRIDFRTPKGEGAEFFITIPLIAADPSDAENLDRPDVLICEDDQDLGFVIQSLLSEQDLSSEVCTKGEKAMELLARHDYQLLLLDLGLPDGDGLDLLERVRNEERTADLPVIIVTGRARNNRTRFDGEALQVVDWIQKPFDNERLNRALHSALHGDKRPDILHVDNDLDVVQSVQAQIGDSAKLSFATDLRSARQKMAEQRFELIIVDLDLPDGSGLELLWEAGAVDTPVLVFSDQLPEGCVSSNTGLAALAKSATTNENLARTVKSILNRS